MKNSLSVYKNNLWYSVILALLLVWVMLILTVWVFRVVLNETYDTDWLAKNFQSYAWAEAWLEMALLEMKSNNYWFEKTIDHDINNESVVISSNPLDKTLFKWNKDVLVSYELKWAISDLTWNIEPWKYYIIPLFAWVDKVENTISLTVQSWEEDNLVWNIIWGSSWISNIWGLTEETQWNIKSYNWSFNYSSNSSIRTFLNDSDDNYLVLFNSDPYSSISFNLNTGTEKFTSNIAEIVSTGEIGKYKQNLRLEVDNSKYLNLLKYSIFSN